MAGRFEIALAQAGDAAAISALLQAHAPSRGGSLTGEFPLGLIERWLAQPMPVLVARDEAGIAGVLFTADKHGAAAPAVAAMLEAWRGREDAYVYGPVCIDGRARGQGLLERLYRKACECLPGREAILFVRRDNPASLRAHARLGMREVAAFSLGADAYAVLSDRPGGA